jgi:hypothetical protein
MSVRLILLLDCGLKCCVVFIVLNYSHVKFINTIILAYVHYENRLDGSHVSFGSVGNVCICKVLSIQILLFLDIFEWFLFLIYHK